MSENAPEEMDLPEIDLSEFDAEEEFEMDDDVDHNTIPEGFVPDPDALDVGVDPDLLQDDA